MKVFVKKPQILVAVMLSVVMLFMGAVTPEYVYASSRDNLFENLPFNSEKEIMDYFDSFLAPLGDEISEEDVEKFSQFISMDKDNPELIKFDPSKLRYERYNELLELYPNVIAEFGDIYSPEFKMYSLSMDQRKLLYESFDTPAVASFYLNEITTIQKITSHVYVMNCIVNEGGGSINEDYELELSDSYDETTIPDNVFPETVDAPFDIGQITWEIKDFTLSWYKFTVKVSNGFSIIFSVLFIAMNLGLVGLDVYNALSAISADERLANFIIEAFVFLPEDLAAGLVGLKSNAVLAFLTRIFSIAVGLLTATCIEIQIITILISLFIPSIVDSIVVLANSILFYKGALVQYNWQLICFWDDWGISIRSIDY